MVEYRLAASRCYAGAPQSGDGERRVPGRVVGWLDGWMRVWVVVRNVHAPDLVVEHRVVVSRCQGCVPQVGVGAMQECPRLDGWIDGDGVC